MLVLAVPVVLSELGWMAQGVVDTIMVGRLGPEAIGAVALGNAVFYVPSLFGIGLLLGLDTLVSQAYGRSDHEACHHWLAQGIYLAGIVTLPLMLLIAAASYVFSHVGVAPEVAGPAGSYLRLLNWSTLPLLFYGAGRRYLQGVGQVRVITLTLIIANLVNWFGNWALIYGRLGLPALGVDGSAISTCVARVGMAVALIGFAWRYERSRGHPLFRRWAKPSLLKIRQLTRLGAPAAGQIVLEVGAWNTATFCAGLLTPVALATHSIALNYASITYMVPLGMSAAAAVSVGHAIGAGDPSRARRAGWLAMGLGTGFMLLAAVVFLVAPQSLIALYTRDPRVLAEGPAPPLPGRRLSDIRRHPDRVHWRPARPGRNQGSHDCQLCRLLDTRTTPGYYPLFCPPLGHIRPLDRAHPRPHHHRRLATHAVAQGLSSNRYNKLK